MAASNTDLFKKCARKWVGQIGSGGVADDSTATIPLASVTNLPTDTAVVAVIDRVDANGTKTPTTEESVIGVVSGTDLVTCTRGAEGTAQAHSAGAVVEILITNQGWGDLISGILVEHNQLGGHTNITASNITASAVMTALHVDLIASGDLRDANNNELLKFTQTASAVNEFTVANAITGGGPTACATGSDTNISINLVPKGTGRVQSNSVTVPTISSTDTLTNKRITKRLVTTTDDATAEIDTDSYDEYELSAVANATTFTLTGTPTDGQTLIVRVKDAGVTKGLTWTGFTAVGVTLPTATTAGKWHYVGCKYNLGDTAWHAIAVTEEA